MPRPANWKSDGPTCMERIRHLSWVHYRDMTTCKRCGAPLPDQSRSRGRKRTYCSAACQGGRGATDQREAEGKQSKEARQ